MKPTWRYWVNKEGGNFTGKYYEFKCFKVYWAYRWFDSEKIDKYTAVTPVKKQWGMELEPTNYAERYGKA
jgi:hypothetical protein